MVLEVTLTDNDGQWEVNGLLDNYSVHSISRYNEKIFVIAGYYPDFLGKISTIKFRIEEIKIHNTGFERFKCKILGSELPYKRIQKLSDEINNLQRREKSPEYVAFSGTDKLVEKETQYYIRESSNVIGFRFHESKLNTHLVMPLNPKRPMKFRQSYINYQGFSDHDLEVLVNNGHQVLN